MRKKVLLVFGTRPEAIKMAPLVRAFEARTDAFETMVCVTGQHREMLDSVLHVFNIKPDFDLNIMRKDQDLFDVTSRVLVGMRKVLAESCPDIVFVHGDTTTSTAAALSSFYMRIPVAHIEAGLRTYDIYSPWPEEMNRQLTGRIATYHFAPTDLAMEHLIRECVPENRILVTGNTVIDALRYVTEELLRPGQLLDTVQESLRMNGLTIETLDAWQMKTRRMILVTGHRRENFGEGFRHICEALRDICFLFPDVDIVYPMHLNPNVRQPVHDAFDNAIPSNLKLIEPLEYIPFVRMMQLATIVLTDSGGIQEEAPGLGKPVLVMRDVTERPEAVTAGTVKLVGTNREHIVQAIRKLLTDESEYRKMSQAVNPYGDGRACSRIVEKVLSLEVCK